MDKEYQFEVTLNPLSKCISDLFLRTLEVLEHPVKLGEVCRNVYVNSVYMLQYYKVNSPKRTFL